MSKLKSRKLWVTVLASAITTLAQQLGLDSVETHNLALTVSAYLVSQGAHDAAVALRKVSKK